MGIFDFFGGKSPEKAVKLKAKVTQRYGDPTARQKAIEQLGNMKFPEAVSTLLSRFTINVEPQTTDAEEKEHVFHLVTSFGEMAVAPTVDFLRRSDQASSWALRILAKLVGDEERVRVMLETLQKLGPEYTRAPEKKTVLLHALAEASHPDIAPLLISFLQDPSDEVKLAAIQALAPRKYEPAREPLLTLLTEPETARRVQTAVVNAIAESGFDVKGFREKVEPLVPEAYTLNAQGVLRKRA